MPGPNTREKLIIMAILLASTGLAAVITLALRGHLIR